MADGSLKFDTSIDDSGFNKGAKKIEQSAKKTAKKVGSSAKDAGKDAEKAADEAAGKTEKAAGKAEQKVKKSAEASKSSAKEAGKSIGSDAEQAGEKIRKSSEKTSKGIKEQSEKTSEGVGKSIGATVDAVETLSQALVAAGVAASVKEIAGALLDCTQASRDFEARMAKVGTIADASQKPLEDMRDEILQLSGNTGKSVGELSEAAYQAISASVATKDAVDFVGTANKLAVGGFSDTTTAVDILTTAINAYGMSADDASRISDVLITTQNLGKTSVAELGSSMGMVIPLAAAYNMNLEDLSASYALLTANGTQTAQATTYVKAALNELGSTSSVVGSTLKKQTGKTFAELMADGNSLGDVLQVLADSVDGDRTAFNNMWSSAEAGVGMLSILNSGTSKYNSLLKSMEGSTGAVDTAFEKMSGTAEFAQQRLSNAADNLKIAIGDALTPALSELQGNAADAMQWATDFVEKHPQVVAAVSALAAALGVLAAALAGLTAAKAAAAAITALNTALAANPAGMVAIALASLTAAVVTFGHVTKDRTSELAVHKKAVIQCKKSYEELKTSVEEHEAAGQESIKNAENETAAYQNLADKLYELSDKTNKTAADKAQMNAIVDQLNQNVPELGLAIDQTTGALNKEKAAVDEVIESMKQKALASAYEEQLNQATLDQAQAEQQLAEARKVYNDLLADANKESQEYNQTMSETSAMVGATSDVYEAHNIRQSELTDKLREQKEVVEGLENAHSQASQKVEEAAQKAGEYKAAAEEVNAGVTDSAVEMSEEVQKAYDDMKSSIQSSLQGTVNMFDEFSGGEEINKDKILGNLKSSAEGVKEWSDNMKSLAARAGDGMTKELYDYLLKLGPQSANLVKACTEMTGDELKEMAESFSNAGGEGAEGFTSELASISANWETATQDIVQSAGEAGQESAKAYNEETKSQIESGKDEIVGQAKDAGTEVGKASQEATAAGIEQNSGKVTSAVDGTMQKAEDAALGYYNGFYNVGANLMRGTVAGMTAESPAVERVAREAVRKAIAGAKNEGDVRSPSHVMRDEVGKMLAAGMAEGILDGTEEVEKSAREMARASVDVTKDELEIHSPSDVFRKKIGKNIVKGVIKGIQDDQKLLNKEMGSMCGQAVEAAESVDAKTGNYSDVGSAIIESIAAGLDSRKELTSRKLEKKINGYVDKAVGTLEKKADNAKSKKKKKKYQEDAEALKEFADEYVASFLNALNAGIDAEYDRIQAKLDDKLTEISDRYQELYDTITSKQAGMMGKMSIPSNLYDLDTQLEQIERYQNGLNRLKGKIPDTLMDEILGMDVNEADNFVEYLNSLTDSELAAYKEKWGSLQSQSKSFSESFFSSQLGSLKAEYQKEIEDATKDVQAQMKSVGKNIAAGLIKGLESEKEVLDKACRKIANGMIKQFKDTFKIKSPSKVMETQVGRYLPPGIADGFEEAMPAAEHRITDGVLRAIDDLQCCIDGMQYRPAVLTGGYGITPHVNVTNSQPVQVQAEIHTTVDLDGRVVGRAVTPYVNQNLGEYQSRERRGS